MAKIPDIFSKIVKPLKFSNYGMGRLVNPTQHEMIKFKPTQIMRRLKLVQHGTRRLKPTLYYMSRSKCFSLTGSKIKKLEMKKTDTTEDACTFVSSTSVAKFNDLYGGAHIQLGMQGVNARHVIVERVDVNKREFTVIGCTRNIRRRKSDVIEEVIKYPGYGNVLLYNYEDNVVNHLFTRLPRQASVSIAQYFRKNPAALHRLQSCNGFENTCQHFVVSCTFGYDFCFKQIKQIMIAFEALQIIDKRAMNDLAEYMLTKKVVKYNEGDSYLKLTLKSSEDVNIHF